MNAFLDHRILERLRAEYLEMPGMKLKAHQVQRLCGIDQATCALILGELVKMGFLCLKADGTYVRLTEGRGPVMRTAKATLTPTPLVRASRAS